MSDEKKSIYEKLNAFKPLSKEVKKHPCPDCFNCLFCSELRCQTCLAQKKNDRDIKKNDKKE